MRPLPPRLAPQPSWAAARGRLLVAACAALWTAACAPDSTESPGPPGPESVSEGPQAPLEAPRQAPGELPSRTQAGPGARLAFPDEAAARGLVWTNRSGRPDKPTVLEANGPGVALFDLGADGDLDVAFAQGLDDLAGLLAGPGAAVDLFENTGSGRFEPVAPERVQGLGAGAWWTGLAAGDLEGDGDADLVAGAFGDLAVLRQERRDGAPPALVRVPARAAGLWPRDATLLPEDSPANLARAGLLVPGAEREPGHAPLWHTSLALFDADRDGDLDLYAGRYLALDPLDPPTGALGEGALALPCSWKGHPVYCGPRGLTAQPDAIFEGLGNGTFRDRTSTWLPDHVARYTLAVTPLDADMDGDTDLHVANDSEPDLLLWNGVGEGAGLRDVGPAAGLALNPDGLAEAGMGAAVGDLDRDGRFDLAVTNFSGEPTQLHLALAPVRGGAPLRYRNVTYATGLASATRPMLSWSTHLLDLDLDARLELVTANGHVYPQADAPGTGTSYGQPDALFRFDDDLRAVRVELEAGDALAAPLGTRGLAVGDLDGDGALDLVLAHVDAPAALGRNLVRERAAPGSAQRLVLRLEGPVRSDPTGDEGEPPAGTWRTPRDAMGTRVVCVPRVPAGVPEFALLQEVQTARGFQSASSPELVFGLGRSPGVQALTILWPSGAVETFENLDADRRLHIREGAGIVSEEDLP